MADVQHGNVPSPQAKRNRLVVFDDLIDKLGHDEELEALGSDQVMQRYLHYLKDKKLPDWEVPNMIAKYYTSTKALEMATK